MTVKKCDRCQKELPKKGQYRIQITNSYVEYTGEYKTNVFMTQEICIDCATAIKKWIENTIR